MISKINTFTFIFADGDDCSLKHLMRNNETLSFPKLLKELRHTNTKHAIMFSENFPQYELHFVPTKSLPYCLVESSFHHSTNQTNEAAVTWKKKLVTILSLIGISLICVKATSVFWFVLKQHKATISVLDLLTFETVNWWDSSVKNFHDVVWN